jgi:hypothetical protein
MEVSFTEPDVYGQIHPIETPELVEQKLKELAEELDQLPDEQQEAWRQAKSKCPQLVDKAFQLPFLRCEVFHVNVS